MRIHPCVASTAILLGSIIQSARAQQYPCPQQGGALSAGQAAAVSNANILIAATSISMSNGTYSDAYVSLTQAAESGNITQGPLDSSYAAVTNPDYTGSTGDQYDGTMRNEIMLNEDFHWVTGEVVSSAIE
jgi:hypothetical protein